MATPYQNISVEGVRQYMAGHQENEYVLIDVRQPDEYTRGHVPGAVLIPLGEISARINELPVDKDVIVYCRSGHRSQAASVFITSQTRVAGTVYNMEGGIMAWNGQLLPDTPNMKVFDLTGSEQSILHRAMDIEKGADLFYTSLRDRYPGIEWAESLGTLAKAEENHAHIFYRYWAEGETNPPGFEEVYRHLVGDIVEGGYSSASLLSYLEEQQGEPCRTILEMALTLEFSAYDLCRNLAHHFRGGRLEEVFNTTSEAEKEHMRQVAQAFSFCESD